MKHLTLTLATLLVWGNAFTQEISLEAGLNFSSYIYSNSAGNSNDNIKSDAGLYSRLGLGAIQLGRQKIGYGLSFQQFNATGGDGYENYNWATNYLGGFVQYQKFLYKNTLGVKLSLDLLHLVSGKQKIGGETFDLTNEKEMNGTWINPSVGLFATIVNSNTFGLDIGYNFSYAVKPADQGAETLSYAANQVYFRVHLKSHKKEVAIHEHEFPEYTVPDSISNKQSELEQDIQNLKLELNLLKQPPTPLPERTVFFNLDSYKIDKDQYEKLETLADYLRNNPTIIATLVGYADDTTGQTQHNQTLSDNRAKSVQEFLISLQVDPSQCTVKGAGETSQFNQKIYDSNRRVIISLTPKN